MSVYPTEITLTYTLHDVIKAKDPYSGLTMLITQVVTVKQFDSCRLKFYGFCPGDPDTDTESLLYVMGDLWPDNRDPLFLSLTEDAQDTLTEMYYDGYNAAAYLEVL